jgi:hypothetical protein
MNEELQAALEELEDRTRALLAAEITDVDAVAGALERRAQAITRVALAAELSPTRVSSELARLTSAIDQGDEMTRRLHGFRQESQQEWAHWNQELRRLKATGPESPGPTLNFKA